MSGALSELDSQLAVVKWDGEAFRVEIKASGRSVEGLANEIGLSGSALYKYLSNERIPRIDDIGRWAMILRNGNPVMAGRLVVKLVGLGMRPKGPRS